MNDNALVNNTRLRQGRYVIYECLGPSPLGYTYLARDRQQDNAQVTVEEFFPHGHCRRTTQTTPDGQPYEEVAILRTDAYQAKKLYARFMAMARTLHNVLNVDGITGVTAAFKEGGTAYYVHHYIPGPTLDDVLRTEGPLGRRRVMRYFASLCHTVDLLAMRGISIGSLSPQHIIISTRDDMPVIVGTPLITGADAPAEDLGVQLLDGARPHDDVYVLGAILRDMVRDKQGYYPSWFTPRMQAVMDAALNVRAPRRPLTANGLWDALNSPDAADTTQRSDIAASAGVTPVSGNGIEHTDNDDTAQASRLLKVLIVLLALSALIWIYLTFINA